MRKSGETLDHRSPSRTEDQPHAHRFHRATSHSPSTAAAAGRRWWRCQSLRQVREGDGKVGGSGGGQEFRHLREKWKGEIRLLVERSRGSSGDGNGRRESKLFPDWLPGYDVIHS